MKRKYFIFDLDGTLCESMAFWRNESRFVKDFRDPVIMEPIYEKMHAHYDSDIMLKDGVTEFLESARSDGIKMCIASATRRNVSQPLLDKTGIMDFMEFYIDCHEIGIFKERPDIYLMAAERLGADISECVVFEDAEYCAKTAQRAGFYVVGVYDKTSVTEGDTAKYSDLYITGWNDLFSRIR